MKTGRATALALGLMMLLAPALFGGGQSEATEQKSLAVWAHITSGLSAWNKIAIPMYEKEHPNIKVDYSEYEFATFTTKIITAVSGGGGPDIFDNNAVTKGAFEPRGIIQPLNLKAMGYSAFDDLYKEFLPGSLEPWKSKNGELLGLPYDTAIWQLYVNTKLFKDTGLDASKDAPKTWEDFYNVSEKIHKATGKKGYQLPFGAGFGWYLIIWSPMLWQNGGQVFDDNQMSALDSPATRKAFQMWDNIRNRYATGCVSDYPGDNPVYEFAQGGSAMTIAGAFAFGQISTVNSPEVVGNYTVVELPQINPADKVGVLNSWGWMINRNSKQVDEASEFIKWYFEQSVEGYLTGMGSPPRYDVYDHPKVKAMIGYDAFKAGLGYARPREGTPYYNETGTVIMKALDEVVLLKKPMEPVIKEMHEAVNKIQKGQ